MAEQDHDLERTEPASERRIEKAREEGQVIFSRDWVSFLLVGSGCLFVHFFQKEMLGFFTDCFRMIAERLVYPLNDISLLSVLRKSFFFF